jgi:hypothetical protein
VISVHRDGGLAMTRSYLIFAAGSLAAASVHAADRSPEAQLAKAAEGRVAGTPVSCITLRNIRSSRIVDGTAIIYEMQGGTRFINRPDSGAPFLRSNLTLVTNTGTTQLCNVDIVGLYDPLARMTLGSIGLGKFVPYPRP